jgi:hypothetical protein
MPGFAVFIDGLCNGLESDNKTCLFTQSGGAS